MEDPTKTEQWYRLEGDPTIPNQWDDFPVKKFPSVLGRSYNNKHARTSMETPQLLNIRIYFGETLLLFTITNDKDDLWEGPTITNMLDLLWGNPMRNKHPNFSLKRPYRNKLAGLAPGRPSWILSGETLQ